MKISREKFEIALAVSCKTISDLRSLEKISGVTLSKVRRDPNFRPTPRTVGKIARALGISVEDLIDKEDLLNGNNSNA